MQQAAVLCCYGYQDVYRILGRDPLKKPLSELERHLFYRLVLECFEKKVAPQATMAAMTGTPVEE